MIISQLEFGPQVMELEQKHYSICILLAKWFNNPGLENTMTLALHILLCSIVQKVSHYLARTLRCLRVIRWPSLNLPLHVVMHIDNFILRKPLWKNFSDGPLRWSGKKETATQTLREMQLEWNHSVRGTKKTATSS